MNLQDHMDYLKNLRSLMMKYDLANRKVDRRKEIDNTLKIFKIFKKAYSKEVRDRVENPRSSP